MTIAIALSLDDGIVLGADSATTFTGPDGTVSNVYFNAEKIINLAKGLPIAAAVYGVGNLEGRSITSLAKDLREQLEHPTSGLDPRAYTVEEVTQRVKRFFFDDRYSKLYPLSVPDAGGVAQPVYPAFGFIVAGFSAMDRKAEMWSLAVELDAVEPDKVAVRRLYGPGESGLVWRGQPEALTRLIRGYSSHVHAALSQAPMSPSTATAFLSAVRVDQLVTSGMPVQDGIDLVHYLAEVTMGFVRFTSATRVVAPPIDSASITYHEGFKWVRRKHYYDPAFNPPVPDRRMVTPLPAVE